jgi:hypothetical protein
LLFKKGDLISLGPTVGFKFVFQGFELLRRVPFSNLSSGRTSELIAALVIPITVMTF